MKERKKENRSGVVAVAAVVIFKWQCIDRQKNANCPEVISLAVSPALFMGEGKCVLYIYLKG